MANTPPTNLVQLVSTLRQMAADIAAYVASGGTWPGPPAADIAAAATALETLLTDTDNSYTTYKTKKAERDANKKDAATPLFRSVVAAAYLVFGKSAEELRNLGLEPLAPKEAATVPDPPEGVDVREVSETSVLVDWDPVGGADRYHVYVGQALEAMELHGSAAKSELTVGGLTEGTKYFFHVTSVNAAGESAPSNFTTRRTL